MTEEMFADNTAALTEAINLLCLQYGLSGEDQAALAGASLGQVLTRQLGPFGAVERLRMLADLFEAQVLKTAPSS